MQRPHVVERGRAHVERAGRLLGDDVRRRPALGDDAVEARLGPHLLAQHAHVVEGLDHGVQRVHALPGIGRGVGGLAGELEAYPGDAEQILVQDPAVEAVNHHCGVHALEHAGLDQLDLAAATLLGRRADHLDAPGRELVAHGRERGARARPRGRDDVVAAGVPDGGQRVVLAQDGDGGAVAGFQGGAERRLDAGHAALDLEALAGEIVRQPAGGLHFLVGQLGIVVDPARELLEIVGETVHRPTNQVLDCAHAGLSRNAVMRLPAGAASEVNYITRAAGRSGRHEVPHGIRFRAHHAQITQPNLRGRRCIGWPRHATRQPR